MRFPLFIDLSEKKVLVVGGGTIALRRIKTLVKFGPNITVLAPDVNEELKELITSNQVLYHKKVYESKDCNGYDMVLACTNQRKVNHFIVKEASENGSFYNSCDCKEECNFYFPGVATREHVVIGVTASGQNHSLAKELTQQMRQILKEQ